MPSGMRALLVLGLVPVLWATPGASGQAAEAIATKAVARLQSTRATTIALLNKQEAKAVRAVRRFAASGRSLEQRQTFAFRQSIAIGLTAERQCQRFELERVRALSKIAKIERTISAEELLSARARIRAEREAALSAIRAEVEAISQSLGGAAALDVLDEMEASDIAPVITLESCGDQEEMEEEAAGGGGGGAP